MGSQQIDIVIKLISNLLELALALVIILIVIYGTLKVISLVVHYICVSNLSMYKIIAHYAETGCHVSAMIITKHFDNVVNLSICDYICYTGKATVIDYKDYLIIDGAYAKIKASIDRDEGHNIIVKEIESIEMK